MEPKYASYTELKELDELLLNNNNDPIWHYKVKSRWAIAYVFSNLLIAGIFIYFLRDAFNVIFSLLFVIPYVIVAFISNTMTYTILPNAITFQWGIFGRKKVTIPFSDMTSINLVEYENSKYSTIYFGTKSDYKIKKINYDTNESRAHITFENVKDGPKVTELLNLLWERNRITGHNSFRKKAR